jgi:hypothetical protein
MYNGVASGSNVRNLTSAGAKHRQSNAHPCIYLFSGYGAESVVTAASFSAVLSNREFYPPEQEPSL